MNTLSKGEVGERLVSNFFDENFSKIFSFPHANTKTNAQVADILVWLNRTVFLIEVKTRDEGTASIQTWFRSQTQKALGQIRNNFDRIKAKEPIFLRNDYYHTELEHDGLVQIIGVVVLVYEEECIVKPSDYFQDIYKDELPIHVFAWKDLEKMIEEIDTIPDFIYYLQDRLQYVKKVDIPLGRELHALGYYKSQSNKFPETLLEFSTTSYWDQYKSSMEYQIGFRNEHNKHSTWIDALENLFIEQRKLYEKIPLGLIFAWEIGALSRRERAYFGEKLDTVQQWFDEGNSSRYFAVHNGKTGNWIIFYFSQLAADNAQKQLWRLAELKLIREAHLNVLPLYAAYAFGFGVSVTFPRQLLGLNSAFFMGRDAIEGQYSSDDIEESLKVWGDESANSTIEIDEFPT